MKTLTGFLFFITALLTGCDASNETEEVAEEVAIEVTPTAQAEPVIAEEPLSNIELTATVEAGPVILVEEYQPIECILPPTSPIPEEPVMKHYTWTDADGIKNYSSNPPPAGVSYEVQEMGGTQDPSYFQLDVDFREGSSVVYLGSRLSAQANAIYEIMNGWLGPERLRQVSVNLVIFPNRGSFLRYYRQAAGADTLENTQGFYSTASHEAVTFQHPDDNDTITVARHETVHVIATGIMGLMPIWLNEGLAEYFSHMSMNNLIQEVSLSEQWLTLARDSVEDGYPINLSDYLALSDEEWKENNLEINYALAWSLVYFLASTEKGRASLTFMLQELADNYCESIDSDEIFALTYERGTMGLEDDFFAWLSDESVKRPHRY